MNRLFLEYQRRVAEVDYQQTFQYLCYHTPFGGMVKGAHRTMMRKMVKAKSQEIEMDFEERVLPGLKYGQRVGNIMGGSVLLSLLSTIDQGRFDSPKRIGCFSYGSGCCSEFYSGIVSPQGQEKLRQFRVEEQLNNRYHLTMEEYEELLVRSNEVKFGTRNVKLDLDLIPGAKSLSEDKGLLVLEEIHEFHRKYRWL